MSGAEAGDRGGGVVRGDGREGVGGGGGGGEFRYFLEDVSGVGSEASEVLADHILELLECAWLDVELPVEMLAHLALYLVDLPELNMPWPTIDQDLLEQLSSQITLEAIMNAEMKRRWPDEPRAVGNLALSRWRRTRATNVTEECSFVRCKA